MVDSATAETSSILTRPSDGEPPAEKASKKAKRSAGSKASVVTAASTAAASTAVEASVVAAASTAVEASVVAAASTAGKASVVAEASAVVNIDDIMSRMTPEQKKDMLARLCNSSEAVANADDRIAFNGMYGDERRIAELFKDVTRENTKEHLQKWWVKIAELNLQLNSLRFMNAISLDSEHKTIEQIKQSFENLYDIGEVEFSVGKKQNMDDSVLKKLYPYPPLPVRFGFKAVQATFGMLAKNGEEVVIEGLYDLDDQKKVVLAYIDTKGHKEKVVELVKEIKVEAAKRSDYQEVMSHRKHWGSCFVKIPSVILCTKNAIDSFGGPIWDDFYMYQMAFAILCAWYCINPPRDSLTAFLRAVAVRAKNSLIEKRMSVLINGVGHTLDLKCSASMYLGVVSYVRFDNSDVKLDTTVPLPAHMKAARRKNVDGAGSKRKRESIDGAGSKKKRVSVDGSKKKSKGAGAKRKTGTDKAKSTMSMVTMHIKTKNPQGASESSEDYQKRIEALVNDRIAELNAEKQGYRERHPKDEGEINEDYEARITKIIRNAKRNEYAKTKKQNVDKVVDPKNAELAARFQEGRNKKENRIAELINGGMTGEAAAKKYAEELKEETNKKRREAARKQRENEKACIEFISKNFILDIENIFENSDEDAKIDLMKAAYTELCTTATAIQGRYKLLCYLGVYKTFRSFVLETSEPFLVMSPEVSLRGDVLSDERVTLSKVCDLIKAFIKDFVKEQLKNGDFVLQNCETGEDGVYADASTNMYKILKPFINLWELTESSSLVKVYNDKGYKQDNVTHILSVLSLLFLYKMIQEALELSKDGTKNKEIMSCDPSKQLPDFKNIRVLKLPERGVIFGIIKRSHLLHWYDSQEFSGLQDLRKLPKPAEDVEMDV